MLKRRINRKFNHIYKEAKKPENLYPLDYEKERVVLFSDHHKGDGSAADDFKKNVHLYDIALSYYKREGYKLVVLGDNEELWENRYEQILPHYEKLIIKEIEVALESSDKKKIRLWGNHDKEVSLRSFKRYCQSLDDKILHEVDYREGLCLGEDIFLIHGHQGRFFEDIAWKLSRWAVQFIWKTVQKLFHIGIDGPAENYKIRDDLEINYYAWAKKNKILLICGHTHCAIFGSLTHLDRLQMEIHRLEKSKISSPSEEREKIKEEIEKKKARIKKILRERSGKAPKSFEESPEQSIPCYFNDGCCLYTNGITCIEIDRGSIRLIKWQQQEQKRITLAEGNLQIILKRIKESLISNELLVTSD